MKNLDTKPIIKLYGERNTGTNYLSQLIETNLDVKLLPGTIPVGVRRLRRYLPEWFVDLYFDYTFPTNLGWKHSLVKTPQELLNYPIFKENIHIITLTKNPYSWLLSLYRRPYHLRWSRGSTFEVFIRMPWRTVRRENAPPLFDNPIIMWNEKNKSYIPINRDLSVINIRYEDFLIDPEKMIEKIVDFCGCNKLANYFTNVRESTKEDSKNYAFYRRYYLEEQWREKLTQESIDIINEYLDRDVLTYYGYKEIE